MQADEVMRCIIAPIAKPRELFSESHGGDKASGLKEANATFPLQGGTLIGYYPPSCYCFTISGMGSPNYAPLSPPFSVRARFLQ